MSFSKAKLFLTSPSGAFDKEKKTELGAAGKYMFKVALITAVLSGIISAVFPGPVTMFFISFVGVYLTLIVGLSIGSLWLHLWALLMGASGYKQTMKAVFYGSTPYYLLGWIPAIFTTLLPAAGIAISVIIWLWSMVLTAIGLTKLHGISKGKAAGAIIISVIIPAVLLAAFALAILLTLMSVGSV